MGLLGDTLGFRNNNPGNLRPYAGIEKDPFEGMTGTSAGFLTFATPEDGARAAAINLMSQFKKPGVTSIASLGPVYAPASDGNNPAAWASNVARATGLDPNARIDISNPDILRRLTHGVIVAENGSNPYSPDQLSTAVTRAVNSGGVQVADSGNGFPSAALPPNRNVFGPSSDTSNKKSAEDLFGMVSGSSASPQSNGMSGGKKSAEELFGMASEAPAPPAAPQIDNRRVSVGPDGNLMLGGADAPASPGQAAPSGGFNMGDVGYSALDGLKSFGKGVGNFGKGVVRGARNIVDGGAQLLTRGAEAISPEGSPAETFFRGQRENVEAINRESRRDFKENWMGGKETLGSKAGELGGEVAATLPAVIAAGPAGLTIPGAALTGAAMSALTPINDAPDSADFWKQKLQQTAVGGVGGAVGGVVAKGVSPNVAPNVQAMIDRGISVTPGQIAGGWARRLEEAATSIPFVGDTIRGAQKRGVESFNKATINETLAPITAFNETAAARGLPTIEAKYSGAIGRDGYAEAEKIVSDGYNKLLPKVTLKADQQFVADIQNLRGMASSMPQAEAAQFENILKDKVVGKMGQTGQIDGLTFKGIESELGQMARGYMSDPSFDKRQLGKALRETLASLRETLARTNPAQAEELRALNSTWANITRLRDASSRIGTEEGVFTPAQLLSAVRAGDKSMGKGAFARGDALLQDLAEAGKGTIANKMPDSGTAGRLATMGLLSGGAFVNPLASAGAVSAGLLGMGAYTRPGQALMQSIMTKRPELLTRMLPPDALARVSGGIGGGLLAPNQQ